MPTTAKLRRTHPLTGEYTDPEPRARIDVLPQPKRNRGEVQATYDAARNSTEFQNHWANADALDADSANNMAVRRRLVQRSRYETANNGYVDGIVQTYATDLVGIGPKLRMQTNNPGFNAAVETVWYQWSKAVKLRRKLWTMAHAKVQDGEAFAIIRNNPRVNHKIGLDVVLIETEQCHTPFLPFATIGYIDGIKFDEYGNPEYYDVLPYHPGGQFFTPAMFLLGMKAEEIPAKFVLHWFLLRRPGQHRGVPEFRSTLNVGAQGRRWREATIAAAETAADFAALIKTAFLPDEMAAVSPMASFEIRKRMAVALPDGYEMQQFKAEHPNSTYTDFHRAQLNEQARPKSMPYNKAACDSSSYNYASGRLDHQTYYGGLDVEREDGNDLVLDPLFDQWWAEAVVEYGWNADPYNPPLHSWDWPKHPVADVTSEAEATDKKLRNGTTTLSRVYSENGEDFEDDVQVLAQDYYGDTSPDSVAKVRETLRIALFNSSNQQSGYMLAANQEKQTAARAAQPSDTLNAALGAALLQFLEERTPAHA